MSFFRRLFGGDEPQVRIEVRDEGGQPYQPEPPQVRAWLVPPEGSPHPNAPTQEDMARGGANERDSFRTPDGVVVLYQTYRPRKLAGNRSKAAQEVLASLPKTGQLFCVLSTTRDPQGSPTGVEVYRKDILIGELRDEDATVFIPYIAGWESRGWKVLTRGYLKDPSEREYADDRRLKNPWVEILLPTPGQDELYANARGASMCFTNKEVFGPSGRTQVQQSPAQSEYRTITVHAGDVAADVDMVDWKPMSGGETEGRGLNFSNDQGTWMMGDLLPESITAAGFVATKVVGVTYRDGIGQHGLSVGSQVQLRPEPTNPKDPNAIAVWGPAGVQVGYLPAEIAATVIAEARRRQRAYHGLVTWEFRVAGSSDRVGIRLLIGPEHLSLTEP